MPGERVAVKIQWSTRICSNLLGFFFIHINKGQLMTALVLRSVGNKMCSTQGLLGLQQLLVVNQIRPAYYLSSLESKDK